MSSPQRPRSFDHSLARCTAALTIDDAQLTVDEALARYARYIGPPSLASLHRNSFVVERSTSSSGTTCTRPRVLPSSTTRHGALLEDRQEPSSEQLVRARAANNGHHDRIQEVPEQDEIMADVDDAEAWGVDVESSLDKILASGTDNADMTTSLPNTTAAATTTTTIAHEGSGTAPITANIRRHRTISQVQVQHHDGIMDENFYHHSQRNSRVELQWGYAHVSSPRDEDDRDGEARRSYSLLTSLLDLLRSHSEAR